MTAPASHPTPVVPQASLQAMAPPRAAGMRVSLAFVEHRVNVWLRFGQPTVEIVLDRWRRVAMFTPRTVCCRVKWIGNDYGTALWQLRRRHHLTALSALPAWHPARAYCCAPMASCRSRRCSR